MRASSFGYLSGQGVKSLWKNRMMTLASLGVLTACLLIVGVAVLLTENINEVVQYVESQNEFKAFVYREDDYLALLNEQQGTDTPATDEPVADEPATDEPATDEPATDEPATDEPATDTPTADEPASSDAAANFDWDGFCMEIQASIQALPNVESVVFVSKDEGIESMKNQLGDNAQLLEDYVGEENPLNDSFTIKVRDLSQMQQTTRDVAAITGIYTVSAANEVAQTLTDLRNLINIAGTALVAALVVVSLVIVINTIRATIFSRRKELNIMRYVGATKAFIRLPFIVEGVLLGLISASIAYVIIWQCYSYALKALVGQSTSWLNAAMENIIPFEQIALPLGLFFAGASVLIGVIGSAVSIQNHIKV